MKQQSSPSTPAMLLAIMLATLFALTIFVVIEWTRPRVGTIILPAGSTYLGPTPSNSNR